MIINTDYIIKKTDLRQNLASVLTRVKNGDRIFVSDRGNVIAVISSINSSKDFSAQSKKVIEQQKEIREFFMKSRLTTEDTTKFIRDQRNQTI